MPYAADLHLHSRYAYACSKNLSLETLAAWAKMKGIDLLASADFTHPAWFGELQEKLTPVGPGVFSFRGVHFVLGTEVSCVYSQGGRHRRLHLLLFAPDFATVGRLNRALENENINLASDGRPTLRLSARDFTALALEINPQCMVIPAHVWTPWYGLFGSKSGFDHLEECFLDMTRHIHAVETGLSSDPAMNWSIPGLEDKTIVSFSDAHSAPKLGREMTVFQGELTYPGLAEALKQQRVEYSVEFYPQEGKYHYSGHRKCGISLSPEETERSGNRCPVCRRPLTLGVLHRVRALSLQGKDGGPDCYRRDENGFVQSQGRRPPFIRLIPLVEIIAEKLGHGTASKGVQGEYQRIVLELGSELHVLLRAEKADLEKVAGEELTLAILKARTGDIDVEPGYDGIYGKVRIWPERGSSEPTRSRTLGEKK